MTPFSQINFQSFFSPYQSIMDTQMIKRERDESSPLVIQSVQNSAAELGLKEESHHKENTNFTDVNLQAESLLKPSLDTQPQQQKSMTSQPPVQSDWPTQASPQPQKPKFSKRQQRSQNFKSKQISKAFQKGAVPNNPRRKRKNYDYSAEWGYQDPQQIFQNHQQGFSETGYHRYTPQIAT